MEIDFKKLDRAFNPKCLVVVGDKKDGDYRWLRAQSDFKGHLYSIQIDPNEIEGIKALGIQNYTSMMDIPEPVDLVIVSVPRAVAPRILEDCIRKDAAAAHFFTAGFSESGTEEGKRLEKLMVDRARQANFHLIGPNCLGIFSPKAGIKQTAWEDTGNVGAVGFISQSGMLSTNFCTEAPLYGVYINKAVSIGNGMVIDAAEYLDYFGQDPEIKAIGMYIEGIKHGNSFLKVLKKVSAHKPVVIWKGGRTAEGSRATASHTASLAIPQSIWGSAIKQAGGIGVTSQEELIDTLQALLLLPPVRGDGVAIIGGSGGQSVAFSDAFVEAGLKVPLISQKSYDEIAKFFIMIGGSFRNPIDIGMGNRREMAHILEILAADENMDSLVMLLNSRFGSLAMLETNINMLAELRNKTNKPVAAIVSNSFSPESVLQASTIIQKLQEKGIPGFTTIERSARALKNARDYYKNRQG